MKLQHEQCKLERKTKSREQKEAVELVKEELESQFYLQLNTPIIHNFHDGIEFLGITISDTGLSITEKRKRRYKRESIQSNL